MKRTKYNTNGYEVMTPHVDSETSKYQTCSFANYPKNLDTLEYMRFLPNKGDFHIADFYTINHDLDNMITFTPKTVG